MIATCTKIEGGREGERGRRREGGREGGKGRREGGEGGREGGGERGGEGGGEGKGEGEGEREREEGEINKTYMDMYTCPLDPSHHSSTHPDSHHTTYSGLLGHSVNTSSRASTG